MPRSGSLRSRSWRAFREMIDILADQVGAGGILLTFAPTEFPDLCLTGPDQGGVRRNWYRWAEREMDGWLCPALFKYFPNAPDQIWIAASLPR